MANQNTIMVSASVSPFSPTPRIRAAREDDAFAIADTHIKSWQAAYTHLFPADVLDNLSRVQWTKQWRNRIRENKTVVRVIDGREKGEIAGFSMYGPTRDDDNDPQAVGELYALYLGPKYWGSTYAMDLWNEAKEGLIGAGFIEATLWVLRDNFRARGFYQKAGFVYEPGSDKTYTLFGVTLPQLRCRQKL